MHELPILRPATARDHTTVFRLYVATRSDEMNQTPWSPAQRDVFLRSQFEARRLSYARDFPEAKMWIIVGGGEDIGAMTVQRTKDEIRIVDMALFPAHRGAGIGRHLLETLQFEAAHARRPLRLSVRKSNPARRLYERLGFSPIGFAGDYIRMEWTPPPT